MRSRYKFDLEQGLYFITSSIVEFLSVFTSDPYFRIITNSFSYCRQNKNIKIFAYVILENHFHLLISGVNLTNVIRSIKRHTAREIIKQAEKEKNLQLLNSFKYFKKRYKNESNYQVWQEGAHPQYIFSLEMLEQKMDYIHYNPVSRGLVENPEDWLYSSARNYHCLDSVMEIDKLEEW